MYIRDPSRKAIFEIEKFNHKELEENPELEDEVMRAYFDINYDEFLQYKPDYEEYLEQIYQEWLQSLEAEESA
jgi:hypothetical protein